MKLLIAAQKAILTNADSTPERKERARAELRGIPENDPRYADAQQALHELNVAVPETAKVDLDELSRIYETVHNERKPPEQRQTATECLAEIDVDKVIAEYLALPANLWEDDGEPKYRNFEELANWVLSGLVWTPDEKQDADAYREKLKAAKLAWTPDPSSAHEVRMDRLKSDRVGIIVRAHKLAEARARQTCSCDYSVIFGDKFYLSVHWCATSKPPHSPKEINVTEESEQA